MKYATLCLLAGLFLAACSQGPRDVAIGAEECARCLMLVSEAHFAAQLRTERGRTHVFDSIECMGRFARQADGETAFGGLWATDFTAPGSWIPVEEAFFLQSDELRSPMGMNLSAYATEDDARAHQTRHGGHVMRWSSVLDLLENPDAPAPTMHDHDTEPADANLRVGPNGDVSTLTEALAAAAEGDRIIVLPGVYTDFPLTIDKRVELIGEGNPVLDGQGRKGILTITAPGVTVRGFVLRNTGVSHTQDHAAIRVDEATDCAIENNRLEDNFFAIYLAKAHGCVVRGNDIRASGTRESSSGNGIHLWDVERAVVEGNTITGHRDGIYLEFARSVRIRANTSTGNLRYGLHFMFSDSSYYEDNTFSANGAGVAVMYSRDVAMTGNRFEHNQGTAAYGLLLKEVKDSRIENNRFHRNTTAILSDGTDRLIFRNNRIEHNGWAVKIRASSQDNVFTGNDFIENTFDVVTNSRRSYNTFEKNYWSRYDGYDLTGDGIGDRPYRPVRLFSFIVETKPMAAVLLRSFFVDLLDIAERVLPVLTPATLIDDKPLMRQTAI
jgi:nitrous oxidase accessory protein